MAKDDYHVIVYKILIYLYTCLKQGEKPSFEYLSYEKMKISESYWNYILRHMYQEGYVEGISLVQMIGTDDPGIKLLSNFMITPKGIEYLENNSTMNKAKEFLKTVKEIIPGM